MIDLNYGVDTRVISYSPPDSAMAECLQRPAYLITPEAVTAAYMKDWRMSRALKNTNKKAAA